MFENDQMRENEVKLISKAIPDFATNVVAYLALILNKEIETSSRVQSKAGM